VIDPETPKKKRRKTSRTGLRLKVQHLFEARGWTVQPVEFYNPYSRRTVDLFGLWDLEALRGGLGGLVSIQVSPEDRAADHRLKMIENPNLAPWLTTGAVGLFVTLGRRPVRWWCSIESIRLGPKVNEIVFTRIEQGELQALMKSAKHHHAGEVRPGRSD